MERKHNPENLTNARNLRHNMTPEERHLWYDFLRAYPIKFTRQKILGWYIADFYSASAKLIIELDGSQHYDLEHAEKDTARTQYLEQFGILVLRIPNNAIHTNFSGVCDYIDRIAQERTKS